MGSDTLKILYLSAAGCGFETTAFAWKVYNAFKTVQVESIQEKILLKVCHDNIIYFLHSVKNFN